MQIVIDIPDGIIESTENGSFGAKYNIYDLCGFVMNGTPLPKNHGRLIDADALMIYCRNQKSKTIDCNDIARFPTTVPTVLEAESEERSRTMTRAEAIKELENISWSDRGMEAIYMAIDILEQEPKWIPVSERLPEEGLTVLIFTESGDIEFGQRDENKWEWLAESMSNYWTEAEGVIAWQPLPEPYEESDGE